MAVSPNTDIYFCNVPWDSSYKHISDGADSAWILSTAVKITSDYTYQRKDSIIKAACPIDDLINANYVAYNNRNHENKWFYAFIDRLEYIGENRTDVYIKTDVYQTWRSEMVMKQCFVEREHVSDDTPGLHTVPESLETGDYILHQSAIAHADMQALAIVVAVTEYWNGSAWAGAGGNMYNGVYSGVRLYYSTSPSTITAFLDAYLALSGVPPTNKIGAIVGIWLVPQIFVGSSAGLNEVPQASICPTITKYGPARPSTIDGYTPKNKKLLTFPYVCLTVDNNAGSMGIFKYEDFSGQPTFNIFGGVMPNPSYKLVPTNMINGASINHMEFGLTITGFPMCTWSTDSFAAWLGQNSGSLGLGAMSSITAMIGGAVAGSPFAMVGGVMGALGTMNQMNQKMVAPDQMSGSLNSPSANIANRVNNFYFKTKTIKAEYARIIDEFFSRYGYKVNRVKTPVFIGRAQWNYIKTVDCTIAGGIPIEDRRELCQIFDRGVTVWHNPGNFGNFSLANGV